MKKSDFNKLSPEEKRRYMRLLAHADPVLHRIKSSAGGKKGGPAAAVARKKKKAERIVITPQMRREAELLALQDRIPESDK